MTTDLSVPMITPDDDPLTAALAYAKEGWYLGPLKTGTKHPGSILGKDWQRKTSRDPQRIASWFAGTDHGIFLHAGLSGAIVFDVDTPENLAAPIRQAIKDHWPPYQATRPDQPGRGHYIFAAPEGRKFGNSIGNLGNGWGEIRGSNGVIVVAPSKHENPDGMYEWDRSGPVPVLPGYLATQLPDALDASDVATNAEAATFLAAHSNPATPRPDLLDRHVHGYLKKAAAGESRHHEISGPLAGAMKEAKAGYLDAKLAANTLESVFLEVVAKPPVGKQGDPRTGAVARDEWAGLLRWAVGQAQAADAEETRARIAQFPPPFTEISESEIEEFWGSRDALERIRQFAYARMCSPWAVLGVGIIHTLHHVPSWVTLPPLIGGRGSLNLFTALVAISGGGKGSAEQAIRDVLDLYDQPAYEAPLGSGEGIAHQYAHWERKEGVVRDRDAVIFSTAEIDTIAALHSRQGSTLTSQLRSAFMGERLGFGYADATRRLPIAAHSYRFGLIVGVQPERAGALLDQSDGGTPQRFIWLPATDPHITADPPPEPQPLKIKATRGAWKGGPIPIPDQVTREIREAHAARNRGEGDALDGHALFAREKVAFALALWDERREVNLEDWRLAGIVMAKSDAVRASVIATLNRKTQVAETARALSEGRREVIRGQVVADHELQRACQAIVRKLRREGGWVTGKVARDATGKLRHRFDEAIDKLVETGQIEVERVDHNHQQGIRIRLSEANRV